MISAHSVSDDAEVVDRAAIHVLQIPVLDFDSFLERFFNLANFL